MAKHLDLEEQEQLEEFKHFWKQYGNLISTIVTVVLVSFAAWNGYQYWQRSQAVHAASMYDEFERIVATGDVAKAERAFGDMKDRFAQTAYAPQAGLVLAKLAIDKANQDVAKTALSWVAEKSSDAGLSSVGSLRLASLYMEQKAFDQALSLLGKIPSPEFVALYADRKGDIFVHQAKPADAKAEYLKAYAALDERSEYRRLIEIKLNALGGLVPVSTQGAK
jgi:predicted negative regulator of RcsB-dependent stress response